MTSNRARNLSDQAAAVVAAHTTADKPPPSTPTPPRAQPVRMSLDLPPDQYRAFKQWCVEAANQTNLARITGIETIRALIDQLLRDPELEQRIRDAIASERTYK